MISKITGVDRELIFRFSIILQAIASRKEIDTLKFDEYCKTTAQLYVTLYNWYYMPVTVHKILLHGAKIIESAVLPVGQLTEEAQKLITNFLSDYSIENVAEKPPIPI